MGLCDNLKNWDALLKDERLDVVQDLLAHMAEDYDVPVPEVVIGPVPGGIPDDPTTPDDESNYNAAYDADTNTMYMNQPFSEWTIKDDPSSIFNSAGHEFAHELFKENYGDEYDLTTPEGRAEFNHDSEAYAQAYEDQLTDELDDYCDDPPPESPGVDDNGEGDWVMSEEDPVV